MKVERSSNIPIGSQSVRTARTPKQETSALRQDTVSISGSCREYVAISKSEQSGVKPSTKSSRLLEALKKDTSFTEYKHRSFIDHPIGREAAKAIILEDENLQEEVAKNIWKSYGLISPDYMIQSKMYVPASYKEINVKALLLSSNPSDVDQALIGYDAVLRRKAATFGLTENERLLSARAESVELSARGTFDQQMASVFQAIETEFKNEGMEFDRNKSYEFSLDTSVFKFSVSGGTEEENAIIERVINTSNYKADHLHTTLTALYDHRHTDGKYNPWKVEDLQNKEAVPVYGIASVSREYSEKMKQLFAAYNLCCMDLSLKEEYGFGVKDMHLVGGQIVGKTEAVDKIIKEGGIEFMKTTGYPYMSILKNYTGTPEFSEPVFKFEGGQFCTTYQVYDEPKSDAINSDAMLEQVKRELEESREAEKEFFERGRNAFFGDRLIRTQDAARERQTDNDSSIYTNIHRRLFSQPVGRVMATALSLSDPALRSQAARMMHTLRRSQFETAPYFPINYAGILTGPDETAIEQMLAGYDFLLNQ